MRLVLTQQEADSLLKRDKHYMGDEQFSFPGLGGALRIPLYSNDRREEFSLDIARGRIELRKNTFQTRARRVVILARVDIGGPPHRNPDGKKFPAHTYIFIGKDMTTSGRYLCLITSKIIGMRGRP